MSSGYDPEAGLTVQDGMVVKGNDPIDTANANEPVVNPVDFQTVLNGGNREVIFSLPLEARRRVWEMKVSEFRDLDDAVQNELARIDRYRQQLIKFRRHANYTANRRPM